MFNLIPTVRKFSLLGLAFLIFAAPIQADEAMDSEPEVELSSAVATTAPKAQNPTDNIDCTYHIPPQTMQIDPNLIMRWTEKAVQQSFDFEHTLLPKQLDSLKLCFTDLGWQSFNEALTKSGNLEAIKKQKLVVSGMIDGQSTIVALKTNQWKVTVPLQVVYQNDKEKITQKLLIELVVGRKSTGDLGIAQMIASPKTVAASPTTPANPANPAVEVPPKKASPLP